MVSIGFGEVRSMMQNDALDKRRSQRGTDSDFSVKWDPHGENPHKKICLCVAD